MGGGLEHDAGEGLVGDMATEPGLPTFEEHDRTLFSIEDPRERADALRDLLVPKLADIHGYAHGQFVRCTEATPKKGRARSPPSARTTGKTPRRPRKCMLPTSGWSGLRSAGSTSARN